MDVTAALLIQRFDGFLNYHSGPLDRPIIGPSSPQTRYPHSIVFTGDAEDLETLAQSQIAAIVVTPALLQHPALREVPFAVLFASQPRLAMAKVLDGFFPAPEVEQPHGNVLVHPTAVVHPSAEIGKRVTLGPYSVVGKGCRIGDNAFVSSHCVLEPFAAIGEGTFLAPHVVIGARCVIGRYCRIHSHTVIGSEGFGFATDGDGTHIRIPHHGRVVIEDDVRIGAGVYIDRGTLDDSLIGKGTKIDNNCHFAHNSKIGRQGLLTAGVVMAGSSEIGDRFVCGGRLNVNNRIRITDDVQIVAVSTVTGSIDQPGRYGGYPLQESSLALKNRASIGVLFKMRKLLNRIARKLEMGETV
jgi:UDP-3-O-[3-hydroxymyristoyl] glucosamine N-acyltransferase